MRFKMFAFLSLIGNLLSAAVIDWDGGGDGVNFDDPMNWTTDMVPGFGDEAIISGTSNVTIRLDTEVSIIHLFNTSTILVQEGVTVTFNNPAGPLNDAFQINDNAVATNRGIIIFPATDFFAAISLEEEGIFHNYGMITINGNDIYNRGIEIEREFNLFINHESGSIQISDIEFRAIDQQRGDFINNGEIVINEVGFRAIVMGTGSISNKHIFTNNGFLTIIQDDEVDNELISISSSNTAFENNGRVDIQGLSTLSIPILLANQGLLENNLCGTINISMLAPIVSETAIDSLRNYGAIGTLFTGSNNFDGVFLNDGVLQTPSGMYMNVGTGMFLGSGILRDGSSLPIDPIDLSCNPAPIPALSHWSLIILFLIMTIVGTVYTLKQNKIRVV